MKRIPNNLVAPSCAALCVVIALLSLASPCSGEESSPAPAGASTPSELDQLRALEEEVARVIESTKVAFAFIQGGSGFLVSADGYVLTNEHVVAGRKEVMVQLLGGKTYRADVCGHDPEGDVALLKIPDVSSLPFLELGDSDALKVGQKVVALGDPFLLGSMNLFFGRVPPDHEPSASLGVVSAIHRYSDIYSDAIQVDVAVNRGNSGGPLLTLDGKAVGINGKIETRFAFGINTGVGYAIPSNQIKNFLDALKGAGGGLVRHGVLPGLGVAERAADKRGLEVIDVQKGTGAENAGFQKGDLILSIEGYPIVTRNRIRGVLNTFPAEREITVKVARGSEIKDLKVKLEARRPRLPPGTRRV